MKVKLNSNHPDDIIGFIKQTEFAGMVEYDKHHKSLVPLVEGIKPYFDPVHGVLEIIDNRVNDARMVIDKLAEAWNEYMKLPPVHEDETSDFRFHIHALQALMYARPQIMKEARLKMARRFLDIETSKDV